MGNRLYVGNLSYHTTDARLREAFGQFGEVVAADLVLDRMTGQSRGFGFVEFADAAASQRAIEAMNGADLDGRSLTVNEARERTGGGGGGFGGGGGGDRGGRGGRGDRGGRGGGGGGGGRW